MPNNKLDPKLNVERVKKSQGDRDRLTVTLEQGTISRIQNKGFKASAFAREVIMRELETIERISKKNS